MTNLVILLGTFFSLYLLVLQRLDGRKVLPRQSVHAVVRDCLGAVGVAVLVGLLAGDLCRHWQVSVTDIGIPLLLVLVLVGIPLLIALWAAFCAFCYMVSTFIVVEKTLVRYPPPRVSATALFAVTVVAICFAYGG